MIRLLSTVLILLIVGIAFVSPALASREVTVTRIDDRPATPYDPLLNVVPTTCQVGNLNPAYWAIPGYLLPPEQYKLVFDPMEGCANCPFGYQITSIHMLLQSSAACSIVMSYDLEDALYPDGPDCPNPGPVDCDSGLFQVDLPQAGLWDINLPINCGCAFMEYEYLLGVYFASVSCADGTVPDLVTDNFPSNCTSWNNYGAGWEDVVVTAGFPGNLNMWADAECCENPIGTESKSWGAIKELFRN